jgi:hypothetical protein
MQTHDLAISQHQIPLKEDIQPVRKKKRQLNPMLCCLVQIELKKICDANIIIPIKYLEWVANLVPIRKKDGEI